MDTARVRVPAFGYHSATSPRARRMHQFAAGARRPLFFAEPQVAEWDKAGAKVAYLGGNINLGVVVFVVAIEAAVAMLPVKCTMVLAGSVFGLYSSKGPHRGSPALPIMGLVKAVVVLLAWSCGRRSSRSAAEMAGLHLEWLWSKD